MEAQQMSRYLAFIEAASVPGATFVAAALITAEDMDRVFSFQALTTLVFAWIWFALRAAGSARNQLRFGMEHAILLRHRVTITTIPYGGPSG
jgi:hypothetical protein